MKFIRIPVPFILVSSILDETGTFAIKKISTLKFATGDLFDLKASENRYWTCNRPLWDLCLSNPFLGVEIGLRREREIFNLEYPSKFHQLFAILSSSPTIFQIFLKLSSYLISRLSPNHCFDIKKIYSIEHFQRMAIVYSREKSWFLTNGEFESVCKVLGIIRLVPSNVYITGWKIYTRVRNTNAR